MVVVAAVGIFTAILAASIAFTQRDIKRVLAYSTLSQLGYMFAGLGVGAFIAAIFHLMTHGFFKGLLFLGSGSVIHAVHDEQDMNKMGALWRKIPITHWTMLIGAVAIAGIPPLAGFWSKDEILGGAFENGFYVVWIIGVIVAVMTGFYMFRLMGKTFYGESHVDPHVGRQDPRVAVDDDAAAHPARDPVAVARHRSIGFPPDGRPAPQVARRHRCTTPRRTLGIVGTAVHLRGHRRRADHHRRRRGRLRRGAGYLVLRHLPRT